MHIFFHGVHVIEQIILAEVLIKRSMILTDFFGPGILSMVLDST